MSPCERCSNFRGADRSDNSQTRVNAHAAVSWCAYHHQCSADARAARRRYPTAPKNTLEDVSIFCSLNSRVAVIGPNGAGKSTMIKVRAGARAHGRGLCAAAYTCHMLCWGHDEQCEVFAVRACHDTCVSKQRLCSQCRCYRGLRKTLVSNGWL